MKILLDEVVTFGDRADEARDACPDGVCVAAEAARERGAIAARAAAINAGSSVSGSR
jgi:hypothetical protein